MDKLSTLHKMKIIPASHFIRYIYKNCLKIS